MTVPDTRELVERAEAAKRAMPVWFLGTWPPVAHIDVWRFIAACSPETIAALAARVEEAERLLEVNALLLEGQTQYREQCQAERDVAEARVEELTEAAQTVVSAAARYVTDGGIASARALDGALDDLRAVLVRESGGQP